MDNRNIRTNRNNRFKNKLYTIEDIKYIDGHHQYVTNNDRTLFSGPYRTKIKPEDLPEWYMYGRYHKELNISDENAFDPHYGSKGGRRMPTSSIFAQIRITDSKKAEAFVNALVVSANDPPRKPSALVIPTVTDLDEIRKMRQRE